MKKRIGLLTLFLLTALLTAGCTMRTVEQMYCVPRRSQAFDHVQRAMDMAMVGLEYASPVSGENQQTVQLADLDGDGVDEYILFTRNPSQVPLNILIFDTDDFGECFLLEVMELRGSAYEKVEYVELNGLPGLEMVISCQLTDQIMGNVSVYSFRTGRAEKLMSVGCQYFITCDMDRSQLSELLVIQPGQTDQPGEGKALASAYRYRDGGMERTMEVRLSAPSTAVERIVEGALEYGSGAVFISSSVDEAIVTDVLTLQEDKLINLAGHDPGVAALRNYYVYPTDIDGDGVMELPSLIPMQRVDALTGRETRYLIRWYSLEPHGLVTEKLYTFHDYGGGWYIQLDPAWATRITTEKEGSEYTFYLWEEDGIKAEPLFTLYIFTGSDRDQQAVSDGRFSLLRVEGVAYSARLHDLGVRCGITEEYLQKSFFLIRQDWKTGET